MSGMFDKLSGFAAYLFGVDISGGGLTGAWHTGRIALDGLTAKHDEATKTTTISGRGGGGGTWHDVAKVDFRTCPSATLFSIGDADKDVVIGGETFRCLHSSGFDPSAPHGISVVNGHGLRMGAATLDTGTSPTLYNRLTHPRLVWPFSNSEILSLGSRVPVRAGILVGASAHEHYNTSSAGLIQIGIMWQDSLPQEHYSYARGAKMGAPIIATHPNAFAGAATTSPGLTCFGMGSYNTTTAVWGPYNAGWSGVLGVGFEHGVGMLDGRLGYMDMRATPSLDMNIVPVLKDVLNTFGTYSYGPGETNLETSVDPANWGVEITWQCGSDGDPDTDYTRYIEVQGLVVQAFY